MSSDKKGVSCVWCDTKFSVSSGREPPFVCKECAELSIVELRAKLHNLRKVRLAKCIAKPSDTKKRGIR